MSDYKAGALVWVKHDKLGWIDAAVDAAAGDAVDVTVLGGERAGETMHLRRHPDVCRPMDDASQRGIDDMINLSELFEGSLLRNLRVRHKADNIYTFTGSILIAVNPYKPVPLYGPDMVAKYSNSKLGNLPPHIFAIADDAYRTLSHESQHKSILISGESGAGKTESTKLIINYLTFQSGEHSPVEQFLLESSPLLEAFGNATTANNNNSSRFGKYVEIFFSSAGKIVGGKVTEYLLEKSRIVRQHAKDRNYHVFYALLAGATPEEKLLLKLKNAEGFHYLKHGNTKPIVGIDDAKTYKELKFALGVVGFSPQQQLEIFQVLAFVLHVGNIPIDADTRNTQKSAVILTSEIEVTAALLRLSAPELVRAITLQSFKTGKDTIQRDSTTAQAEATRDSIAKAVYGRLFRHIVEAINTAMALKRSKLEEEEEASDDLGADMNSVGILDIFGFEVMETNGFEQFCINMANETLQSYFNNHIFKMEQEEYKREGIQWDVIQYTDNEDCLQLLYRKKLSLMNLLDEESFFPSATDDTLMNKFNDNHVSNAMYAVAQGKSRNFTISHYAAKVQYNASSFLEKNMDLLNDFVIELFVNSKMDMVRRWFERDRELSNQRVTLKRGQAKQTVGGQFKDSLNLLMSRLEATDPYFIRCIKPNVVKAPNTFEREIVLTQLRYTGMIETVKIRSLGYSLRMTYDEFYARYFPIKVQHGSKDELRRRCEIITDVLKLDRNDYQLGKTMIFMRIGPKRVLEARRFNILATAALRLAYFGKMVVARARFKVRREATVIFQKNFRAARAVRLYRRMRRAAVAIQKIVRGWRARERYQIFHLALQLVNAALRARVCRQALAHKKEGYDRFMREEEERKARLKEEEALVERRLKEAEEQVRLMEEKRRQAQLDNPGFAIIGLAQELNNEQYDYIAAYDLPPPQSAALTDGSTEGVDLATQYAFAKYASLYLRPGASLQYSDEPVTAGLHVKLSVPEDANAVSIDGCIRAFVRACVLKDDGKKLKLEPGVEMRAKRKEQVDLLWDMCRGSARLTDELFCQLVRHTTMNGSKESVWAGWYLLALLLGCMSPSDALFPYLLVYIVKRGPDGFASHCQRLILRVKQTGARKRPPCSLEYEAAAARGAVMVDVLPGPTTLALDPLVLGDELTLVLAPFSGLPIDEGCGITVNERVVASKAHVMDTISLLEEKVAKCVLIFRRHTLAPDHRRDVDEINRFVADQINNDVFAGAVEVSIEDALSVAVLWFLGNGGAREQIHTLNFDSKSLECVLAPHVATLKDTKTWIADFTLTYDRFLVEDSHAETAFRRMIVLAESWPLYFGHTFAVRQTEGLPYGAADDQLFMLVNVTGMVLFRYLNGRRQLVNKIEYALLTQFTATTSSVKLTLFGNKVVGFDTHGTEVKATAYAYMLHLKEHGSYCIATQSHSVHDPLLLEFATGSVIRIHRSEDVPDGWLKGECNDEHGLFPKTRVELLIGNDPPMSKETILFQATLTYSEESAKSEIVSALKTAPKSYNRFQRTNSMLLDERYTLAEFAKKYFNQPKRSKSTMKNRVLAIGGTPPGSPPSASDRRRSSLSGKSGRRFGSISFPREEAVLSSLAVLGEVSGGFLPEDLSWSPDPLKAPLLSALVSKRSIKLAVALSQGIMRAMGDYPSKKDWREHAVAVIEEGIASEELRDELYCQLMKQLLGNQRKDSVERGWWLMSLCLTSFSPTERLFPYLRQFLLHSTPRNETIFQNLAETSAELLERTRVNGPREHPPVALEFDCLVNKLPIALRVFFPDQSSRSFMLDGATTAAEMIRKVSNKLDTNADVWSGCGLYLVVDSANIEMSIPAKKHIFDAMAEARIAPSNCRLVFKKKLWLGRDDTSSNALNNLVYHQVVPLVLRGLLRCPSEDAYERGQDMAFLAALQYKASGDDQGKVREYAELFTAYIPEYVYGTQSKEEWTQMILSAYATLLSGKSQGDAKALFIDTVRRWPHYGSSFFVVRQSFETAIPENLIMAVSSKGIAVLHSDTKETLLLFKVGEIASWYYGPKHFSLKVHDLQAGDKFIFFTPSGAEITDLLEDYIQALLEQRKKAVAKASGGWSPA